MRATTEDTRLPKYVYEKPEPVAWCECCKRDLYEGDNVMKDNRFVEVSAYICMGCFFKASKKELAELLGASFEELLCRR